MKKAKDFKDLQKTADEVKRREMHDQAMDYIVDDHNRKGIPITREQAEKMYGKSLDEMIAGINDLAAKNDEGLDSYLRKIVQAVHLGTDINNTDIAGNNVTIKPDIPEKDRDAVREFAKVAGKYAVVAAGSATMFGLKHTGRWTMNLAKKAENATEKYLVWSLVKGPWSQITAIQQGHLPPTPGMR